ncbi:hypothetical protein CHCC14820_3101 [Bacillus paralicheniformis]|uniref:Uncharacterized protein n=1 Tax=Bacillus paralicheniformis TaxID=1648923 RepID=A0A6I7U3I9_9BACI|nr:hypothetical protein SC10_B2orf02445 [Bacillus paralicheniformis]OLF87461.1 hypothetical protein B4121_3913 [Bacillus paralicheniformis]OLG06953.1 hypothetical protein B4125_1134 [Bacillus paralicheniformis]TWJ45299.1 hypothetical protein CHCC5027_2040 [Bacillus paralicheniformis]TWJ55487.1 hypothetical protein CHCC5023_2685 [Bacillus paralicheniformis]
MFLSVPAFTHAFFVVLKAKCKRFIWMKKQSFERSCHEFLL